MRQLQTNQLAESKRTKRLETAESATKTAGSLTVQVREEILAGILRNIGLCGECDLARTVGRQLGISARVVDAVLVGYLLQFRSEAQALETGLISALAMRQQAKRDLWNEFRGAA